MIHNAYPMPKGSNAMINRISKKEGWLLKTAFQKPSNYGSFKYTPTACVVTFSASTTLTETNPNEKRMLLEKLISHICQSARMTLQRALFNTYVAKRNSITQSRRDSMRCSTRRHGPLFVPDADSTCYFYGVMF